MEYYEDAPTFEEFRDELKTIFADGDLKVAYQRLIWFLDPNNGKLDPDGEPLTWTFLKKKYREHINWWNHSYGQREVKYLSGDDKKMRKNFYEFIGGYYYEREWVVSRGNMERDSYLFGRVPMSELKSQLKKFKDSYGTGQANPV